MTAEIPAQLTAPSKTAPANGAATPLGEVLRWNLGWALALVLGGLALAVALRAAPHLIERVLGLGLAPAAGALVLAIADRPRVRDLLLVGWALAAAFACGMTGGVAGPLGLWLATPMIAGVVLGGPKRLAQGAALSLFALALTALAQADRLVGPAPSGLAGVGLGLIGAVSTTIGLAAAMLAAQRRTARAAEAQAAALTRLRETLDEQPIATLVLDADGRIEQTFAPAALSAAVSARLAPGPLCDLADAADQPVVEAALAITRAGGRGAASFRLAGEPKTWLAIDIRRLKDARMTAAVRDATPERTRELALEAARADAEALNLGKSRFLANMSHELRTPLNAIMGFSDVMRQRIFGELPGRYSEYADLIYDAGAHLLDLINDVLDMSKIEAAKYELSIQRLDAREPVQAALRLMRLQADDVGVQLRGVLPSGALMVDADQRAVKQITLNLVSNALKFTPKGGLVTVSLRPAAGAMELTVSDTGLGIAAEDLERLGRPYEQAGDVEQQTRGTGLGLSLVRAFAELHGGEMVIESRLGEGTAVTVRLPLPAAEAEDAAVGEHAHAPALADNVIVFSHQR